MRNKKLFHIRSMQEFYRFFNDRALGYLMAVAMVWFLARSGYSQSTHLSPTAMVASTDSNTLFIAQYTSKRLDYFDIASKSITRSIDLPAEPNGVALSGDGAMLYVTCYGEKAPMGMVCVISTVTGQIVRSIPAGHSPRAPVLSPDGRMLYFCNQFTNSVSFFDLFTGRKTAEVPVVREPYAADITPDGTRLVVANLLPSGRADLAITKQEVSLSASVSIINTVTGDAAHVPLTDGANSLADICVSPEGRYAYISNVLSRYMMPPAHVENGWINANGFSIIDILEARPVNVIRTDDRKTYGSSNMWSVLCAGGKILATAAGSHELITIGEAAMHAALDGKGDLSLFSLFAEPFRKRITLNVKGPRSIAALGNKAYIAGYFSDNMDVVDIVSGAIEETIILQPPVGKSPARLGEELFYDASLCMQKWHTCHSCHPFARASGFNWIDVNNGAAEFKNAQSLVLAHQTPPSNWSGTRDSAQAAVRAAMKFLMFSMPRERDAQALDAYLSILAPIPSPFLENGRLSESAGRGKELFFNRFRCDSCHFPPLYTDLKSHVIIDALDTNENQKSFDTPTLAEIWRSGPYFHDGRYASLSQLFSEGLHGISVSSKSGDIEDLAAFVNSLPFDTNLAGKSDRMLKQSDFRVTLLPRDELRIKFTLDKTRQVSARIVDVQGKQLMGLFKDDCPKGNYSFSFKLAEMEYNSVVILLLAFDKQHISKKFSLMRPY